MVHAFFVPIRILVDALIADMVALSNAHASQGGKSLSTGQQSGSTSKAVKVASSDKNWLLGESVRYVQEPDHQWFVLRATNQRELKAYNILRAMGAEPYVAFKRGLRDNGRKRIWGPIPLVLQLIFL